MMSFITANNIWMEINRTYATKETTSLLGSDHTFDSCFFFSTRAHTSRLMSGGEIPASRYRSFTLVGFRQPVIALLNPVGEHDVMRSGPDWCCIFSNGIT